MAKKATQRPTPRAPSRSAAIADLYAPDVIEVFRTVERDHLTPQN
jgi:hypothetical protein